MKGRPSIVIACKKLGCVTAGYELRRRLVSYVSASRAKLGSDTGRVCSLLRFQLRLMLSRVVQPVAHSGLRRGWQRFTASYGALFAGVAAARADDAILARTGRSLTGFESLAHAHHLLTDSNYNSLWLLLRPAHHVLFGVDRKSKSGVEQNIYKSEL